MTQSRVIRRISSTAYDNNNNNNNNNNSNISASASSAGVVAELAATRKINKYCNLPAAYMFQPIALETPGAINSSAGECLADLGRKISGVSGETREGLFLVQRLSIVLQRYNVILLRERFYEGVNRTSIFITAAFINLLCLISPSLETEYQGQINSRNNNE